MSKNSFWDLLKTSDGYNFFFGKEPAFCKTTDKQMVNIENIQRKLQDFNTQLTKAAQSRAASGTLTTTETSTEINQFKSIVANIVGEAQKKAKSAYITLFVIYLALALGFIFWTFIITARIKDDNISFGIQEANAYLILAVTLFLYAIIYLFGVLWLVNKRVCEKWSVYTTIAVIFVTAIIFIWCASVLVGIMQNHGKDCKPFSKNSAGNWVPDETACEISEGEKESANTIFIITLLVIVIVVVALSLWIYSIVKKSKTPGETPKATVQPTETEMKEIKR